MDNPNNKLSQYDVEGSLHAMMRTAQAKQDKEHMKLCMEEATKRKKQLGMIMKDMPMAKAQELKAIVADRLAKSFEDKELTAEEVELISIDVMLKATELQATTPPAPEAEQVAIAAGTQEISDPTATKEVRFAGNLFQDFRIGSTIKNSASGAPTLDNARKNPQDYVQNGSKSKNQSYTEEQLKAELAPKK